MLNLQPHISLKKKTIGGSIAIYKPAFILRQKQFDDQLQIPFLSPDFYF